MAQQPASLKFPLDVRFKIIALAPQISVSDASGQLMCYVRQKMFKLKEAVTIYSDVGQTRPLYKIAADRVLDISAQYHIEDTAGTPIGTVLRRGMRSLWKAHYDIHRRGQPLLEIRELNPWAKVADGFLSEIPLLGMLSGYLFHPAYGINYAQSGTPLLRVTKQPAFLEGRYKVERVQAGDSEDERLAVLSILMMLLLERQRG